MTLTIFATFKRTLPFIPVALVTITSPAYGAAAPAPIFAFHFVGGSLDDGLRYVGKITGLEMLYSNASVSGLRAPRLLGTMSADQALARLLTGSGLAAARPTPNMVVLSSTGGAAAAAGVQAHARHPISRPKHVAKDSDDSPTPDTAIVVTGSNIRGQTQGASPLTVIDHTDLANSGRTTVADALAQLPQNFGGTATESSLVAGSDKQTANVGAASSVNLRGLGSNATLTLIDGRRVAGSGGAADFTDLSTIPLIAVDRIEVLADGASALYGSDAVGGVVNIKLRQKFDGAESQLRLGTVTSGGTRELDFGQLLGKSWATGHVLLAYEYYHRDALASASRRFAQSQDLRPLGGDDFRSYYSVPGTILAADPTLGGYVPAYAIPAGQDGTHLTPDDFTPGANLQNQQAGTDLLPRQTRHSVYLTADQQIGSAVRLYAEGRYAHRNYAYDEAPATALFSITPADPFFVSPDGSASSLIAYSFANELGATRNTGHVSAYSATLGATVSPGGDWQIDTYVSRAQEKTLGRTSNSVNTQHLDEALGNAPVDPSSGYDPAIDGYFNPYGTGSSNSAATLAYIGSGFETTVLRSEMTTVESKSDGTLLHLPGGPLRLAIGASWRRERLLDGGMAFSSADTPTIFATSDEARSVAAGYAELAVPLFGRDNALPMLRRLDLSLAFRYEHHSDYGSTTNPKLGLVWTPVTGLTLRGSYGTSFRAPALPEVHNPYEVSATQLPNAAGGYTPVIFLTGGNANLKPERATSYSLGTIIAPPRWTGFRAEATWFQTRFTNRIGRPAFENILSALKDPTLSPFVTPLDPVHNPADLARIEALIADPSSTVPTYVPPSFFQAIVDSRYVNTAEVLVRGIDVALSQGFRLGSGEASATASATYLIDYKQRTTPTAPLIEEVNQVGYPAAFRAEASLSWSGRIWGGTFTAHHVGGYHDELSIPARHVDSWTTFDLQLRYTPPGLKGLANGLSFALSAQNIADTDPPFVNRSQPLGYDPANADPLGRFVSLQIRKAW